MRKYKIFICLALCAVLIFGIKCLAEEMYIISTRDGSEIIVKDYKFTDEYVEFTTGNGLPGFIKRENFDKISNMVGAPPKREEETVPVEVIEKRELEIWIATAAALVILYLLFLWYVTRKKKTARGGSISVMIPGRIEKKVKTQGHLAFQYKEKTGRISDWVVEIREAYEENGSLFIEGICTKTDKKKTFRADRVEGKARDMSTGRQARIDAFFSEAEEDARSSS